MENIIPVLLVIGGLLYKVYQNYQEEMEKARKRQQKLRPTPVRDYQQTAPNTDQFGGKFQKTIPQPSKKVEITRQPLQSELPQEVSRLREQRKKERKKELNVAIDQNPVQQQPVSFDLRQAVIQAAILERPYK